MNNLDKTQKIIIVIAVIVILFVIVYYIIQKNNQYEVININDIIEESSTQNILEENKIETKQIIVHITGAVKKEGIIRIEEGVRIADVIEKAQGITEHADLSKVNLAYVVQDGQKIYIPSIYDVTSNQEIIENSSGNNVIIDDGGFHTNNLININTATGTELESLTGIGPSTASKIIEYREEHGKFKKIEDIMNVSRNRTSKI